MCSVFATRRYDCSCLSSYTTGGEPAGNYEYKNQSLKYYLYQDIYAASWCLIRTRITCTRARDIFRGSLHSGFVDIFFKGIQIYKVS